jgi:hypothetical protein
MKEDTCIFTLSLNYSQSLHIKEQHQQQQQQQKKKRPNDSTLNSP